MNLPIPGPAAIGRPSGSGARMRQLGTAAVADRSLPVRSDPASARPLKIESGRTGLASEIPEMHPKTRVCAYYSISIIISARARP